jgi:hypothetical protein
MKTLLQAIPDIELGEHLSKDVAREVKAVATPAGEAGRTVQASETPVITTEQRLFT